MSTSTTPPKKTPRAKAGGTTARVEEMRSQAFSMLVGGLKCPDIGARLGVSRVRAWQLVTEGLEQLRKETMDKAEQWRLILTERHMSRLKMLDEICYAMEVDPKGVEVYVYEASARIQAASKAKDVEAELAKLWGAYAPTKIAATDPTGSESVPNVFAVLPVAASVDEWSSSQSQPQPQS